MSLALIDKKLLAFYCLETFANNFLSVDSNDMKILQLDASHYNNPMNLNS